MTTSLINPIPATLWDLGSFKSNLNPNPIMLVADVTNGVGESRYSALRLPGVPTGYQVTAGKTLYITKTRTWPPEVSWLPLSGTADAGQNQVAAPAGAKALASRDDGVPTPWIQAFIAGYKGEDTNTIITVAETLYPCIRLLYASYTLTVIVLAHEE